MNKDSFLNTVLKPIRSIEIRRSILLELESHIDHSKSSWIQAGLTENEAEQKAIQQMGNPFQLGIQMQRLYRLKIDWILLCITIIGLISGVIPLFTHDDFNGFIVKKIGDLLIGVTCIILLMLGDYRKFYGKRAILLGWSVMLFLSLFYTNFLTVGINGGLSMLIGGMKVTSITIIPFLLITWAYLIDHYENHFFALIGLFLLSTIFLIPISTIFTALLYVCMVGIMLAWSVRKSRKRMIQLSTIVAGLLGLYASGLIIHQPAIWHNKWQGFLNPSAYSDSYGYMYQHIRLLLTEARVISFSNGQNLAHLPESITDLIFVTMTATYGWSIALIILFILTIVTSRFVYIIKRTKDSFGQLLVLGASCLFGFTAFYNVGMLFGIFPLVGVWLPLISYGTAPMVFNSILIGLSLSVYRRHNLSIQ